jgi:hypothetical protein
MKSIISLALLLITASLTAAASDPPNVIVILADDQDHLRISSLSINAKCGAISGISSSRATSNSVALRHIRGD